MITVRLMERLWCAKAFDRLLQQLLAPRPEASADLLGHISGQLPAAGMAVIRLDELTQPLVPLYGELVRTLVKAQRPDGGWGDIMTTAICVRALLCGNGNGPAVDCGLDCLADLQKPEGIWPNIPARRMPVDAFASAFVLLRLGDVPQFRQAVDVGLALHWFEINEIALDAETRKLWTCAKRRISAGREIKALRPGSSTVPPDPQGFWDFKGALSVE